MRKRIYLKFYPGFLASILTLLRAKKMFFNDLLILTHTHTHTHIYIYREREREDKNTQFLKPDIQISTNLSLKRSTSYIAATF